MVHNNQPHIKSFYHCILVLCMFCFLNVTITFSDQVREESSSSEENSTINKIIQYKCVDGEYLLTFKVKNADIRSIFKEMAEIRQINLVLDDSIKGQVSLFFRDVPWDRVLENLLRTSGFAAEGDDNLLFVRD